MMNVTANQAFPLHTDLPDDVLSLLGCGITSGVGAVFNVAEVKPGRSVAILGLGHLGLWMIQGARLAGARTDHRGRADRRRREMAGRLGATDLVDPADGDPVEQVRALTGGRGADYVLEAAGMTAAQEQALTTARRAGTIVLTGVERLGATITYPQFELALQGRRVLSCQNGNVRMRRDLPLFVGMLEDGRLDAGADHHLALRARRHQRSPRGLGREARPHRRHRPERIGLDAHLPAARRSRTSASSARPVDGHLPRLRRAGARRLPRARRGRLVRRRQVPAAAWPRCQREPRAAARLLRAARARDRTERD